MSYLESAKKRIRARSEYDEVRDSLQRVLEARAGTAKGILEGSGKPKVMDAYAKAVCEEFKTVEKLQARLCVSMFSGRPGTSNEGGHGDATTNCAVDPARD